MSSSIKIHTFACGSISVSPYQADITKLNPFEKRITLPNNVFLIEHPVHGLILVDTGWSEDVDKILPSYLKEFYRPQISPDQTAVRQLEKIGITPEDIDLLILTHLDIDHTCALKEFAGKVKRIAVAELEYFYSCRYVYKVRQVWDTFIPYIKPDDRIYYRASVLGPEKRGFDLFGDDSILCIYTPGHTDGIYTMLVNKSPSNRFKVHGDGQYGSDFAVIASDNAFSMSNIENGTIPGYGFNRDQQRRAVGFLKELSQDENCRGILLSHESPKMSIIEF